MKKLAFLLLCCIIPMSFWSCDSDDAALFDELTGGVQLVLNGTTHTFTGAAFTTTNGKTIVAATTTSESVQIALSGTPTAKTYTLGFANDISVTTILTGSLNSMENTITFIPYTSTSTDSYIVVAGTCTLTSVSSNKIKGTFSGYAIKSSDLQSGISLSSLTNLKTISGSFTAIGGSLKTTIK
jgi:hypothetical protein